MLSRYHVWGMVLVLSSALGAGCKAPPEHARVVQKTDPARAGQRAAADASAEDAVAQAHAHYAAGVIQELNDEPAAALQEYYQAALKDPGNEALVLEVSGRLLQGKQPEKALEILSRAVTRPNASGRLYARLGLAYAQLGKPEQAAAANRTAIKRAPRSLAGYHNFFLSYLLAKQETEALKVLEEAAKQPNTDAEFLIGLSELYVNFGLQTPAQKQNVNAKALAILHRAEKLNPSSPPLRLKLADDFALLGDTDTAAQLYLELLKKLPELPMIRERVHAKLADLYLRGSDRKRAKDQLEAVIRGDPTNPQAYYWLGSIALDEKKPADAVDYFSKTILLSPDLEQAYYDLAVAQIETGKVGDALATLDKARKKFSQNFALEMLTGMAFSAQKGYAEAIQHFISAEVIARATDPKRLNESFYFQLGAAYERKGDYDQAETCFEKALELAPNFSEAMNYLGYMWAEHGIKLEQAQALIEKALKAEPKNAAYLDSLGWVLFKLNHPQAALTYVLQAAELSQTPDPTLFDHLGDIYTALREPEKAREAWRKSLSLEANEQVRKKLDGAGPNEATNGKP